MNGTVFLDGRLLAADEAQVSVLDRGFLLGDGVYEVMVVYDGRPFLWDEHVARLERSLAAARLPAPAPGLGEVAERLLAADRLGDRDAAVYFQVTRGVAPRTHAFPRPAVAPTVVAWAWPLPRPPAAQLAAGVAAITVEDRRWGRCDIKAISLLANVLAAEEAAAAGVFEALFLRQGLVLEGSHTNLFAVLGGTLVTPPADHRILAGVTRAEVIRLARGLGIAVELRDLPARDLARAEEVFVTGTTTEIQPVVEVDRRPVGAGVPGEITGRLRAAWEERIRRPDRDRP